MRRSFTPALLLGLVAVACGDDSSGSMTDPTATNGSTSAGSATGTETGTDTDDTGTTTGAPFVPIPARGITIQRVQANQGVGVDIGLDGAGVPGSGRASYLLQDRLTLIRGFWALEEGWEPRPIKAILTVHYPDGTSTSQEQTKTIEDEPFEGDIERTFYFGLMDFEVLPGTSFDITLWETQFGQEDRPETEPPPRLPYEGVAPIGIEKSSQRLEVVVVPFNYNSGDGCVTSPDTSDEVMKKFHDYMYMQNPVDEVILHLHDAVAWNQKLSDFNELNEYMSGLRFDEGAGPHVYYYGLVDVCGGGLGGAGGKAYGIPSIPPTQGQAYQRVSSGLWLDKNRDFSYETFVHEVGHSQGRYHIDCGGAAGFDPSYPHDGGIVGEWGFGVIDYKLRHPTVNKDYMTYCHPTWVGTWGWNKVYPVIRETTKWADEAGAPAGDDPYRGESLLVGSLYPDGRSTWITVPGFVDEAELSASDVVSFFAGGEVVSETPAALYRQPEGEIVNVVAPLPADFAAVTGFQHQGALRAAPELHDVAVVDQHHRSRTLKAR